MSQLHFCFFVIIDKLVYKIYLAKLLISYHPKQSQLIPYSKKKNTILYILFFFFSIQNILRI
jgi:hypothetical protein